MLFGLFSPLGQPFTLNCPDQVMQARESAKHVIGVVFDDIVVDMTAFRAQHSAKRSIGRRAKATLPSSPAFDT